MDANRQSIDVGLNLWLYGNAERCSLEKLKQAYSQVYHSMRKGWVESNPEEYQDIMFKEDTERFALFVKEDEIEEEDTLIRFLTTKFNLKDKVQCHSEWLEEGGGYCYNDKIYMWIDKKELSNIIAKFSFEITFLKARV